MKRLISVEDIEEMADGSELVVGKNTIITPYAQDKIRDKKIQLLEDGCSERNPDRKNCQKGVGLDPDKIYHLLRQALDRGILTEEEIGQLVQNKKKRADLLDDYVGRQVLPVGISGRHIHLSQKDLERLFGPNYQLTVKKKLSQPGQFAAEEVVTLCGPKGVLERVRVLGPVRKQTQVEILQSDIYVLGVKAPVKMSGDLTGSPGLTVVGPAGSIQIPEGVIVAARHVHLSPKEAEAYGLHDGQIVSLRVDGSRAGVLENVKVRVGDSCSLDFHIDMDEANALGIKNGQEAKIINVE